MRRFHVSCYGIFNSVIFTKAWSMQAWIPVVSSSLYFWKSICSFRVDSILKWRVYIKLKVSWLRAFLWCMSQTSRDRVNSRRVRTHKKNSGDAVRRLGAHKAFFVPNQEPAFAWPFGNGLVRVGTQGLFRLCLKTFVVPFLPARLTPPPPNTNSSWVILLQIISKIVSKMVFCLFSCIFVL